MRNLKHTIVASIAIVMISSLATTQAAQFKSAKADGIQAGGVSQSITVEEPKQEKPAVTVEVWHESITDDVVKDVTTDSSRANVGYALVREGALNVRADAGMDAEVIDQLLGGMQVVILSEGNGWYQITYDNGKTGYVVSESITDSYETAKQAALESGSMYETGVAVVGEGALNIRSAADLNAEVVDQLDNGDQVIVLANEGEWLKVYYGREYKTGYVSAASVKLNGLILKEQVQKSINDKIAGQAIGKGVISISSGAVNVREEAGEDAPVKTQLDNQTNVLVLARGNGWTKIAYGANNAIGYVKSEYVVDPTIDISRSSDTKEASSKQTEKTSQAKKNSSTSSSPKKEEKKETSAPAKASSKGGSIVAEAERYLGVKYVYGGSSPSGFDCSGLVQYVLRKQGISVPHSSGAQFGCGTAVSRSQLQPGDLVFFKSGGSISHVGIYVGGGQMIHAPRTGKTVSYTSIDSMSRQKSFAGGRRVY